MDGQDQFREQVQRLVAEGKLTAEEAEQLLSAPEPEASPAPQTSLSKSATEEKPRATVRVSTGATLDAFDGPVPPTLHLSVTGYSLTVRVDETASTPSFSADIDGRLELLGQADGWHLRRLPLEFHERGDGWLGRLISGFVNEGNLRAELTIPPGIQDVRAKVQGGNLTLPDLDASVTTKVQGGNLTMGDARELHAKVQGGNLKWSAELEQGRSEVTVQGGNANVDLRPGSSVRFDGRVTAGNMSASGFPVTKTSDGYVNASYVGTLNEGRAALAMRVQGGNARISAHAPELENGNGNGVTL